MGQYFDMMYYYLATFYKRFFKKRSSWDLQSIFVITITQTVLVLDLWMLVGVNVLNIRGKVSVFEKIFFFSLVLILLYLNIRKYEKKYLHYKEIWGVHQGSKKVLYNFLTFFTVVFAWCFILIIGLIFNKN
jgi:hypothetical protein